MIKIKVGLAEDNARFRKAFLRLMKPDPDLDFIIEAENGADLLVQLESMTPDIILLDIRMPVMDGFEAAKIIHKTYPQIKIVAFTQFDLEENIIEMSKIGVKSFVGKNQMEEVPRILKIVHEGGVYYPDKVAEIISTYLKRNSSFSSKCPVSLTELDVTILQGICKGFSSTQIGDLTNKSPRTVEKYRNELYQKFKVNNLQQLIVEASRWAFLK